MTAAAAATPAAAAPLIHGTLRLNALIFGAILGPVTGVALLVLALVAAQPAMAPTRLPVILLGVFLPGYQPGVGGGVAGLVWGLAAGGLVGAGVYWIHARALLGRLDRVVDLERRDAEFPAAPEAVRRIAGALPYRDFVTVGVLARRMTGKAVRRTPAGALWRSSDDAMQALAVEELARIGLVDPRDVVSATVIRVPKAYPAYFGSYAEFDVVRSHLDRIPNLFLVGRNGMHRYNNQDHSMLTARAAVDNIVSGRTDKENLWAINVDDQYHEETPAPSS